MEWRAKLEEKGQLWMTSASPDSNPIGFDMIRINISLCSAGWHGRTQEGRSDDDMGKNE